MSYVIRIVMLATGQPCDLDGTYIRDYTDTDDGRGHLVTTREREIAMQFDDPHSAFQFWNQTSKAKPTRADGEPNKPLTAWTVSVEQ